MANQTILHGAADAFRKGQELEGQDLVTFFDALLNEVDENILADVLTDWTKRGFSGGDLYTLARLMRERSRRVACTVKSAVDVVGTGGSRVKTFNVSTASAFVVAGAGIAVAKHGNGAASSNSGSADVLAELGVRVSVEPDTAERCLEEIKICFMFAPKFNRLSPVLASVRRKLGFPTIFNILGPLCNPAGVPHHLIGVWDERLVEIVANVLAKLKAGRSMVVSGRDGLDEITLNGETAAAEISETGVRRITISPGDFGVSKSSLEGLRVSTPNESAELIRRILEGRAAGEPSENLVLMSAAAAIHLSSDMDFVGSFAVARESIRSGAAGDKLRALVSMTNR